MSKIILKHQAARDSLLKGVRELAELVTITLGPKGRNVALDKRWASPIVVHDGVSVAREVELEDPFENMGAQLVKEAASKTNDVAGDGTTTATLLAWKLCERGHRYISEGANAMILKDGMDYAAKKIIEELEKTSKPVKEGDIEKVATISAADPKIGELIAETLQKVGEDGAITVEKGLGNETVVEYKEGMMFDKGYGATGTTFVTDKNKMIAEIENPMILFTDMVIASQQDFIDFLDNVLTPEDRNLIIIADSFEGYTLPTLVDNHTKGTIKALPIKAPSFGIKRIWMLEDMAILTGGTVLTRQSGRMLASIKKEELGRADKVWADTDNTKIIGGHGNKQAIIDRIDSLKKQIDLQESDWEKEQLKQRIAKLSGGAAVIKVGALTETELDDRRERIIDAVEATKSAIAEGIVAGGGVALLQCQDSLLHLRQESFEEDFLLGIKLVLETLKEPLKKILENGGRTPEVVFEKIKEYDQEGYGYDIVKNQYGNMIEMGIIDPAKVTKKALLNAVSVSSMILTTEGLLSERSEDKKSPLEKQLPIA